MKKSLALVVLLSVLTLSACVNQKGNTSSSSSSSSSSGGKSSSSSHGGSSSSSGQTKITVKAHSLSDSNLTPPVDINSAGQEVDEDTWNTYKYGASSVFNYLYNFTYTAYSGGFYQVQRFTKNGYSIESTTGNLYYERKSGNTFYKYSSTSEGYLRQETTFDLQAKYTDVLRQEVYAHMYNYSDYDFTSGQFIYYDSVSYSFSYGATFQGGYLTQMNASVSGNFWTISNSFETTISIPASYYYK